MKSSPEQGEIFYLIFIEINFRKLNKYKWKSLIKKGYVLLHIFSFI
jgi:hypothetical protein